MGTDGEKNRKPKHPLPKVPRYEEPNSIHLAGLSEGTGGPFGSRLGHAAAHARSQDLGRFGRFVLRLLGRRTRADVEAEPDEDRAH